MLHPELRRRAFLRNENEVRLLAEQDSYMREELEVLRRTVLFRYFANLADGTWRAGCASDVGFLGQT
jgi:hypothetical protein